MDGEETSSSSLIGTPMIGAKPNTEITCKEAQLMWPTHMFDVEREVAAYLNTLLVPNF